MMSAARLAKRLDVGRKPPRSTQTGREVEVRARGQLVEDGERLRPLVAFSCLPRQHHHPVQQFDCCLTAHQPGDAGREHADSDARAVDAVTPAHRCCLPDSTVLGQVDRFGPHPVPRSYPGSGWELRQQHLDLLAQLLR